MKGLTPQPLHKPEVFLVFWIVEKLLKRHFLAFAFECAGSALVSGEHVHAQHRRAVVRPMTHGDFGHVQEPSVLVGAKVQVCGDVQGHGAVVHDDVEHVEVAGPYNCAFVAKLGRVVKVNDHLGLGLLL